MKRHAGLIMLILVALLVAMPVSAVGPERTNDAAFEMGIETGTKFIAKEEVAVFQEIYLLGTVKDQAIFAVPPSCTMTSKVNNTFSMDLISGLTGTANLTFSLRAGGVGLSGYT